MRSDSGPRASYKPDQDLIMSFVTIALLGTIEGNFADSKEVRSDRQTAWNENSDLWSIKSDIVEFFRRNSGFN